MEPSPLILHTWSGSSWSLPSIDPLSINAACYLQLAFPARWILDESNDPDASPNGQLPYLTHGPHTLSAPNIFAYLHSLPLSSASIVEPSAPSDAPPSSPTSNTSIVSRASKARDPDLDEDLSELEKAKGVAWKAIIEGELADLTSYTLYSPHANYALLHQLLATSLPFPQSHYLPDRTRALHQTRLEHVALWGLGSSTTTSSPSSSSSSSHKTLFAEDGLGVNGTVERLDAASERTVKEHRKFIEGKFGEAELLRRADITLSLLSNLLTQPHAATHSRSSSSSSGSSTFFHNSPQPTSLDLLLFSHLSLILLPPFPSATLPNHIRSTYPVLFDHTLRILSLTFPPDSQAVWPKRKSQGSGGWGGAAGSLRLVGQTVGGLPGLMRGLVGGGGKGGEAVGAGLGKKKPKGAEETDKEKSMRRQKWWWVAGFGGSLVTYVLASGLVRFEFGDDEEDEDE